MENNYTVYQHVTPDGMYYFGTTQNVERRWEGNGRLYKTTALQPYIEKYGWDNIQHIVLFENQTKENALSIEDSLIISGWEKGNCINKQRSGLVSKEEGYSREYYEQNKEQIREYKQEYYETNKEQIREKQQQYYEQNKDKFKEYYEQNKDKRKDYFEQNKDKIRKQSRQRYQKNREKKLEQSRQRYQKNREKKLEQSRQRYQKNRDEILERRRDYYQNNRDKRREYQRKYYERKKEEKQLKELGCLPLW